MSERCSRRGPAGSRMGVDFHALGVGDSWPRLALLLFAGAVALWLTFNQAIFRDGDSGWHLGAGNFILRTGTIPSTDPFSFTFHGAPWTAHEWLAEVAMAGLFGVAGWSGVALLYGVSAAVTLWMIGREFLRWLPARWALCALFIVYQLLSPFALARPHMMAWPLLAAWTLILLRAREKNAAPPLPSALLMLIWANLHASYIFALGIAGLFALEALLDRRRSRPVLVRWTLFLALSALAACVTPHGIQGFLYPFQVSGMKALAIIDEWRSSNLRQDKLFALCAAAVWLAVLVHWRRVTPLRFLLLAGLTVLAIGHARHQMLFAIVGGLVVVRLLARDGLEVGRRPETVPHLAGIAAGAAVLFVVVRLVMPYRFHDTPNYPLSLIAAVPAEIRYKPVFNEYSLGGSLVLSGIAPYIDGRADMYGDRFTFEHPAILRGDMTRFRSAAGRWDLRWTLLPPNAPLARALDREPGWKRIIAHNDAVVHIRTR